jgi:hypothetical protein
VYVTTYVPARLGAARHHRDHTGYWSRAFIGWVSYTEDVPLIRHDVTGWEPIADQATARAVPLEKPRRHTATTVVVGEARAPRRQARKPTLVVSRW